MAFTTGQSTDNISTKYCNKRGFFGWFPRNLLQSIFIWTYNTAPGFRCKDPLCQVVYAPVACQSHCSLFLRWQKCRWDVHSVLCEWRVCQERLERFAVPFIKVHPKPPRNIRVTAPLAVPSNVLSDKHWLLQKVYQPDRMHTVAAQNLQGAVHDWILWTSTL